MHRLKYHAHRAACRDLARAHWTGFLALSLLFSAPQAHAQEPDAKSRLEETLALDLKDASILWPEHLLTPTLLRNLELPPSKGVDQLDGWIQGVLTTFAPILGTHRLGETLRLAQIRQDERGIRIHLEQIHHDLPILHRDLFLWFSAGGHLNFMRQRLANPPRGPAQARIDARQAESTYLKARLGSHGPAPRFSTRLIYFAGDDPSPHGTPPRLAWEVHPWPEGGLPSDIYAYIDAQSGELIHHENRIKSAGQAHVFEENPVVDDWQINTVSLLPYLSENTPYLESPEINALACIDNHQLFQMDSDFGPVDVHICTLDRLARADGNGDFRFTPDYTSAQDAFSESSAFYHAHKALDFMHDLGFSDLSTLPLEVLVNYQALDGNDLDNMSDPLGQLKPVTNAFYTSGSVPGETGSHPPRLQFGQGSQGDMAYDGDIVYHEFGHGVVASLKGPRRSALGPYGMHNEAPALNEAYADYLAAIITEDPAFAEYGAYHPDKETTSWRNLDNDKSCGDDIYASSHGDGTIWSGTLWAVRLTLPEHDRPAFDRAVFEAVEALGAYDGFAEAAATTATFVKSRLGVGVESRFLAEAEKRALFDCIRWQPLEGGPSSLNASGLSSVSVTGPAPGTLQLFIDVDAKSVGEDLVLRGHQRQAASSRLHYGGYDRDPNPNLRLMARRHDPITFIQTPGIALGVYDFDAPFVETGEIYHSTYSHYPEYEARIPIDEPGRYYLMAGSIGNQGGSIIWLEATFEGRQGPTQGDGQGRVTLAKTHARCAAPLGVDRGAGNLLLLLGQWLYLARRWRRLEGN